MTSANAPQAGDEPAPWAGCPLTGAPAGSHAPRERVLRVAVCALTLVTGVLGWPVAAVASPIDTAPEPITEYAYEARALARLVPPEEQEPEHSPAELAIAAAREQLGTPYRWAGSAPGGFDCSGLALFAYRQAGIELPRVSRSQYAALPRVPLDELRPGDLVFSGRGRVGHVGIYIGDGQMIHSPQSGRRVEIAPLRRNLIGAGRPVA